MRTFTDTEGRLWELSINYTTILRIKARTGLDFNDLFEDGNLDKLVSDIETQFGAICACLHTQLESRSLTDGQFGESLDASSAEAASLALVEATIDFFRPEGREPLRMAWDKTMSAARRHQAKAVEEATAMVKSEAFSTNLDSTLSGLYASSQES